MTARCTGSSRSWPGGWWWWRWSASPSAPSPSSPSHGLRPEAFADTRPLLVKTADYLERAFLHLDLGPSLTRPFGEVTELVSRGLPADVALVLGGMACGLALGVSGGAACATRPGTRLAQVLQLLAVVALCAPVYFLGMAVVLLFTPGISAPLPLPFVSPNEYAEPGEDLVGWLDAMAVPWLVVGAPLAGAALRTTDVGLRETLGADFVRTATAKGLRPARVVLRHALPPALGPVLGLAAAWVPLTVGNAILVERVFGIPGMYELVPRALDLGNYPLVLGMVIVTSVLVVVIGGVMDLLHGLLDPRVRAG